MGPRATEIDFIVLKFEYLHFTTCRFFKKLLHEWQTVKTLTRAEKSYLGLHCLLRISRTLLWVNTIHPILGSRIAYL